MAELYVIGEIVGASGFSSKNLCCKFTFTYGEHWKLHKGEQTGQTQTDYASSDMCVWSHPVDLFFTTTNVIGWPRLAVQVFKIDQYGCYDLEGYGFVQVPLAPGTHNLKILTWKPTGTKTEEFAKEFLGLTPRLKNESLIASGDDRKMLRTESSGVVHVTLGIIQREFDKQGIVTKTEKSDGAIGGD
ncbi:putative B9 domain-containing protein 2 [Monocercomonoides exilis]|uniref:putative B9 domain-containing protein 2 n=1 Tax=Monocercomonoides exilis TaxID=2049356 RepID=UPI00355A5659|nr:putative B9 domain-containing protein 2 [Monocercomonoides exilis]KAH7826838.1 putative B9 domain-containing protein 2 [Monocercomonoides exilis]|eukprot:MONOS_3852.1-p1 / transcript=MONOS_3852.1 / gene=MONOS_3852 / organism=Monocercomonoides_exilis_PA203 / gene_product=B9 domain-containing protein 2 / transcript_product=B9 domain-containing protein 2 / location=Mono_scaffold00095:15653-16703(+) / protein_length=186 / sequence_SO=supercontig / SO=protein_coding / is_pseudo=false